MNQNDFEELYNDYTQMMLFASSNRPKFQNMGLEIAEIQEGYNELIEDSPQNLLDSLKALKNGIIVLEDEIKLFLFKYKKVREMLRQIDILISDYYNINTEISLYELNGIENDLFNVRDEYKEIEKLKLNIEGLKKEIDGEIARLS